MNKIFINEDILIALFSVCILVGIIILGFGALRCIDNNAWNDGYHSCGGKWVYEDAVGHAYNTTYLYKCDKCGEYHEFRKFRKGEGDD